MSSNVIFEPLDTVADVDTPERVRFRQRLAGPAQRAMAWSIDAVIRTAAAIVVAVLIFTVAGAPVGLEASAGLVLVALFFLEWLYAVAFEAAWSGRTPGKYITSLRVVRVDGSPVRFQEVLLRNLVRSADFFPAFFASGVVSMVLDARGRRLGDLVAGTVVVVEDRTRVLERAPIEPPITEEERRTVLLNAPAVRLPRDEILGIEELLRRAPRLGPERVEELAALLAPTHARRFSITGPTAFRTLQLTFARATGRDR